MTIKVGGKAIDIRAATTGTAHGERATLRILDRERTFIALDDLGFQPQAVSKYKEMLQSSFGMMLVGGPTGSGKTTTLYASISRLDRDKRNIMTIEEPVEYKFTDITQVQVNPKAGITFARGLRSFMRHDPDVIMVGEIRDDETIAMAGQAALTGHLVLSSIHANDAVSTLFRLKDLGMPPYLVAATLIGVVAQRMIRRICPHCRIPYEPTPEELGAYEAEMGSTDVNFIKGRGCNMCNNSGYLGRIGVYETMMMSDEIRQMVLSENSAGDIRLQALQEGMITMKNDGMQKVKAGITTPSEVLRSIFSVGERK
jgi:type II secretory ATPase GspE/PulE/Tfp pilus assembly ATPase PilB-like protein